MSGTIDARLAELGITLPAAPAPAANYVPYVVSGNQVFVAGQITIHNGEIQYVGKLGRDYGVEDGQAAARLCALNIIAQVKAACGGDLDKVKREILTVGAMVEEAVEKAITSVVERRPELAREVLTGDNQIDEREVLLKATPHIS